MTIEAPSPCPEWHDQYEGAEFLRQLAEILRRDMHIQPREYDKLLKTADDLEQAQLQRRSAEAVSRRLHDEREKLIDRVEAALQGIESIK